MSFRWSSPCAHPATLSPNAFKGKDKGHIVKWYTPHVPFARVPLRCGQVNDKGQGFGFNKIRAKHWDPYVDEEIANTLAHYTGTWQQDANTQIFVLITSLFPGWPSAAEPYVVSMTSSSADAARRTAVALEGRTEVAADVFADVPQVRVLCADWTEIYAHAPYDLLVLDGGGQAKGSGAADPERLLEPGGVLAVDDFTPSRTCPPSHAERTDTARLHWLEHPALRTVDLPLAGDLSTVVAVRRTDL
ncbi:MULTISPECIES: hypothetical protein [unclassified Streptomyces]|uniref:hypothetical protein n=1 Tax=unclassified Streptomyces TaxID=2593676 RepID=UPI004041FBB0